MEEEEEGAMTEFSPAVFLWRTDSVILDFVFVLAESDGGNGLRNCMMAIHHFQLMIAL